MRQLCVIAIAFLGFSFFVDPLHAQSTNVCQAIPATKLESFDTNVSVVILKATSELGSISASAGTVAVRCREITDTNTGRKEQGVAIELAPRGQPRDTMLIDYDEIPSLVNAIDYLNKLNVTATPLNALDAAYTTKSGFRLAALGTRRTGVIQFVVRDIRTGSAPVTLSRQDLAQFLALINQAKTTLDSLSAE